MAEIENKPANNAPETAVQKAEKVEPPKVKTDSTENGVRRSSGRSRVKVERFNPVAAPPRTKAVVQHKGKGTPLGDIPNVSAMLQKIPSSHDLLIGLHRILFKTAGKAHSRKKDIREFSGFTWSETFKRSRVEENLSDKKWTTSVLKDLCQLLDLEKSGDKGVLTQRIIDFLENPKPSNRKRSAPTSGASKSGKKRKTKKSKKDKVKRAPTSFIIFANEQRAAIRKDHPDWGISEIGVELGKRWRLLSDSEKEVYKKASEKAARDLKKKKQESTEDAEDDESEEESEESANEDSAESEEEKPKEKKKDNEEKPKEKKKEDEEKPKETKKADEEKPKEKKKSETSTISTENTKKQIASENSNKDRKGKTVAEKADLAPSVKKDLEKIVKNDEK